MPRTWNDNDKYRLLLAIIDTMNDDGKVKMPDWKIVAGKLGPDFTTEAVRQKFQAIKREAKGELVQGGTPGVGKPRSKTSKTANVDEEPKTPRNKKQSLKAELDAESPGAAPSTESEEEDVKPAKKKQRQSNWILRR